jgi:ABC-2 type transport system ATP-binding protein
VALQADKFRSVGENRISANAAILCSAHDESDRDNRQLDNPGSPAQLSLVSLEGLSKEFGSVKALNGLTLNIEPGVIGLVGSNGAGKSTLIKLLLGLLRPTSGSANVLGYNPATRGEELRQYLGYMPEHDCLPPDVSATEFVSGMAQISGLPAVAARERTAETLRHVGLYEERYRPIGGYSSGMKQRVKLAQALVHDPKLLLLDEPTNGLDPARRTEMLDIIGRTGRVFGITVIVSSHLLSEIEQICDHLIVIEGGRLHSNAPLADFTRESSLLVVEVEDGAEQLATSLSNAGFKTRLVDGREVNVTITDDSIFTTVRDLVADHGLALSRLERRRARLEDIFDDAKNTVATQEIA